MKLKKKKDFFSVILERPQDGGVVDACIQSTMFNRVVLLIISRELLKHRYSRHSCYLAP